MNYNRILDTSIRVFGAAVGHEYTDAERKIILYCIDQEEYDIKAYVTENYKEINKILFKGRKFGEQAMQKVLESNYTKDLSTILKRAKNEKKVSFELSA